MYLPLITMLHQLIIAVTLLSNLVSFAHCGKIRYDFDENDFDVSSGDMENNPADDDTKVDLFFPENEETAENAQYEDEAKSVKRVKRGIPDHLKKIFKKAYRTPALEGEVLFMAKKVCEAKFNIDRDTFKKSEVLTAELHLFKVAPRKLKFKQRRGQKPVLQARVSIHQVVKRRKNLPSTTRLLDTSLVQVEESGWMKFDITKALKDWVKSKSRNKGLEVWVESVEPGKVSARMARKTRFVKPDSGKVTQRPALVVYFKSNS